MLKISLSLTDFKFIKSRNKKRQLDVSCHSLQVGNSKMGFSDTVVLSKGHPLAIMYKKAIYRLSFASSVSK